VGDDDGNLKELHTREVEWVATDGKPFRDVPGSEKVWPADLVLLSMGWLGPEDTILDQLDLERDQRSNAKAELEKYRTKVDNVFVAGDVRRGMSLVVWAFREGRGAAREVDRYLMGSTQLP
jgi:glutamate synthase (NADPH/NADH) small chain